MWYSYAFCAHLWSSISLCGNNMGFGRWAHVYIAFSLEPKMQQKGFAVISCHIVYIIIFFLVHIPVTASCICVCICALVHSFFFLFFSSVALCLGGNASNRPSEAVCTLFYILDKFICEIKEICHSGLWNTFFYLWLTRIYTLTKTMIIIIIIIGL